MENYPNPFNPETTIKYSIPEESRVVVKIYNLRGQEIRTLFDGRQQAGGHSVLWDGRNEFDEALASGIYVARLVAGAASAGRAERVVQSRKIVLVK
ncbi:MAG: FlgD immunoglobulin-like domain containing protein [bacterium]